MRALDEKDTAAVAAGYKEHTLNKNYAGDFRCMLYIPLVWFLWMDEGDYNKICNEDYVPPAVPVTMRDLSDDINSLNIGMNELNKKVEELQNLMKNLENAIKKQ